MRICVDFTSGISDPTGVGTYTRELVRALLDRPDGRRLRLAVQAYRHPGWHDKLLRAIGRAPRGGVAVNRMIPHRLLLETERHFEWPAAETLFGPCDVFHGTNFLVPPTRRAARVITVHDLAFLRFAETLPVAHRYHRYLGASVARADRIVAVSHATAADVAALYPSAADRVRVVHEGAPAELPAASDAEFRWFRCRHDLPDRYFLFVGTIEPRKNLPLLLAAHRRAGRSRPGFPGLVLAGREGWHCADTIAAIRDAPPHPAVRRVGHVSEPVRNRLLAGAVALVLPSRYEGFGLPIVEAFRAGTPVLASTGGAIPEIAGDAARLLPPADAARWAGELLRLAEDGDLRGELARRGRARADRYSWERAARETLDVYREALAVRASTSR
jgi:glycosyltransferase involved in cell wall biosynthesis